MTVADLVDEIFRLYRANVPPFFTVAAVIWLPASIALFVFQLATLGDYVGLQRPGAVTPQQLTEGLSSLVTAVGIAVVIGIIAGPLLLGAITAVVSARYLGRPITVNEAIRRAFGCYLRITASYVLVAIAAIFAFLAIGVVGSVLAAIVSGLLGVILAVVAIVAAIVAFVWFLTTWTLAGQVIVIEGRGVFPALRRSRALVSGSRWRVVGINSLLFLIELVLFMVPSTFVAVVTEPLPTPLGPALSEVISSIAQIAYFPIQLGTLTLLYYDLRVRKEGFDLAFAAEQLDTA